MKRQPLNRSEAMDLLRWWGNAYQSTRGRKYLASFAKDVTLFKRLLKFTTAEDVKTRAEEFLSSEDAFIVEAGHTVGLFYSRFNGLGNGNANKTKATGGPRDRTVTAQDLGDRLRAAKGFGEIGGGTREAVGGDHADRHGG